MNIGFEYLPAVEQLQVTPDPTGIGALLAVASPMEEGIVMQLFTMQVGQLVTVSQLAPNLQRTPKELVATPKQLLRVTT